ncbi:uncharacterized protein LOC135579152 isoform X1 [Columba livia]|uniref:uncharacterized protein LOC135579152 isoform X1 n=1 Tax=Columba livia TaxID=8932 RepID=UPI0031BA117B
MPRRGGGRKREPRGGRLAAAGSREGGGVSRRGSRRRCCRLAREAEEPPAAASPERWLWGTIAPRAPSPTPPKSPLLKEPRGPARLKPVAAPWQEEPLTLPETHTHGEAAARGRAPPIAASHTGGWQPRGQSPRLLYGARGGEGRASGSARGGVAERDIRAGEACGGGCVGRCERPWWGWCSARWAPLQREETARAPDLRRAVAGAGSVRAARVRVAACLHLSCCWGLGGAFLWGARRDWEREGPEGPQPFAEAGCATGGKEKSLSKVHGKIQQIRKIPSLCRVAQGSAFNTAKVGLCVVLLKLSTWSLQD